VLLFYELIELFKAELALIPGPPLLGVSFLF